jgi:hypothetical protein
MESQQLYTAIDLLEKAIVFENLTPNPALWKEGLLKENPPRLVRLQQINALASAIFSGQPRNFLNKAKSLFLPVRPPSVRKLLSGAFLKDRDIDSYEEVIVLIKELVKEKEGELGEIGIKHANLLDVYQRLLTYKKQLVLLQHFNTYETLKNAVGWRFSVYLTDSVSASIKENSGPLDRVLGLLLDPYSASFTAEELQLTYKYPTEDIREVDKNLR